MGEIRNKAETTYFKELSAFTKGECKPTW